MKFTAHIALIALSLTLSSAQARTLIEPVGSINIELPGDSDTLVSVPYLKALKGGGEATDVTEDVITLADSLSISSTEPHFLVIQDGTQRGMVFDILSATSNSLTVDLKGQTLTDTSFPFRIYEHWTLDTLFSDKNSIHATERLGSKETLILFPDRDTVGTDLAPTSAFYFYAGGSPFGSAGWRKMGDPYTDQGHQVIAPAAPFTVRHNSSASTQLTVTGNVLATESLLPIALEASPDKQDVTIALNVPVKLSLLESNLYQLGIIEGSSTLDASTDLFLAFNNESTGKNKKAESSYFYYTGGEYGVAGWRDTRDLYSVVDDIKLLEPGQAYVLRKGSVPSSGNMSWRVLAPFLENVE